MPTKPLRATSNELALAELENKYWELKRKYDDLKIEYDNMKPKYELAKYKVVAYERLTNQLKASITELDDTNKELESEE